MIGVENTPDGDGSFLVEPSNGNLCTEFSVDCNFDDMKPNIAQLNCDIEDDISLKNYASIDDRTYAVSVGSGDLFYILWNEDEDEE